MVCSHERKRVCDLNINCDITYQQPMIKWEMLRTAIFENPSVVTKMSESKKDTNQDIDSN